MNGIGWADLAVERPTRCSRSHGPRRRAHTTTFPACQIVALFAFPYNMTGVGGADLAGERSMECSRDTNSKRTHAHTQQKHKQTTPRKKPTNTFTPHDQQDPSVTKLARTSSLSSPSSRLGQRREDRHHTGLQREQLPISQTGT
jgi:hypothetical protein